MKTRWPGRIFVTACGGGHDLGLVFLLPARVEEVCLDLLMCFTNG